MSAAILSTLQSFVAGKISPAEFRDRLYADGEFESFLENDPHLERSNYVNGSAYQFLLGCDFDDPGGVLAAQGAICDFLTRSNFEFDRSSEYEDFYDLVLEASPGWVCPNHKFVMETIMPDARGRKGNELRNWLTEQIEQKYRFVSEPPQWIQSPSWPHGEQGPLVFLGQVDVNNYFHDAASVYVFHDPATGACTSLVQCF
jgi:hypothetical protein